ncbi:MAG TPA: hypothetical protein VJ617_10085 [Arthrobacter sp.]|nr:hypothetical protein [Arthrobacter sp.]
MSEVWDDPDYREWEEHVRKVLIPILNDSAATINMVPAGAEPDVKFAVELGLSILMDKPIICLVQPGSRIPAALVRAADEIVEVDIKGDPEGSQRSIKEAFERVVRVHGGPE